MWIIRHDEQQPSILYQPTKTLTRCYHRRKIGNRITRRYQVRTDFVVYSNLAANLNICKSDRFRPSIWYQHDRTCSGEIHKKIGLTCMHTNVGELKKQVHTNVNICSACMWVIQVSNASGNWCVHVSMMAKLSLWCGSTFLTSGTPNLK